MASYNTSGVTSYTDTSSIAGISAASGQDYSSGSSGLMSASSSRGRNRDADMYAGSKYAPTKNAGTAKAKQSFAATATSSDDDNGYTPTAIAAKFEAAGATLPPARNPMDRFRDTMASSLYDSDMFKPYVPDPTEEIETYLGNTAVEDALKEALGIDDTQRQTYQGIPTAEEPEPNIDMSVLQGALQPEPITVEELPDVITKAGDTLTAIAASVDLPLQAVIDANPQIANPDMIRPGQKINMPSRQLTEEERTALSNVGEITRSQINSITDSTGEFSNSELSNSIAASVKDPTKQSVLKGAIEIETGGSGPVTEDNTYSLKAAKAVWSGVDNVLATLPADVADRLQYDYDNNLPKGQRTASQEDMQLLGEAMMEEKYDGGAAYKGRGLIQITGKSTYKAVEDVLKSKGIDVDLVANPELINDPAYALPAALAYLEYVGLDDTAAEDMTAKELNNKINRGAGREIAEERWEAVISSLRQAGEDAKADELELRNEYAAQDKAGTTVDGAIGPNSRRAMRTYLRNQNVAVPANITDDELVVLVNKN
jgi:predicted chitinase